MGLLGRFALGLAAVGFIPVGVVTYRLIDVNRGTMTLQVLRTHAVAARATAERVAAFVSGIDIPVKTALARPEFLQDPSSGEAQELLANVLQAQPLVVAIELTDAAGARVYLLQHREFVETTAALLGSKELGRAGFLREPDEARAPGVERIRKGWIRLDRRATGVEGWVRIVARADNLFQMVVSKELGDDAEIAVFDRSRDEVLVQSTESLGRDAFPEATRRAALQHQISGSLSAGDVLGAFYPVPGDDDWMVLSRQPKAVAEELVLNTRRQGLQASAAAAALVLAFSGLAWGTVIKPIRRLLAAQRAIVGVEAAPTGGNELDALRRAFEILAGRVRRQEGLGDVVLGRYEVRRIVGEGSMGTVFLAYDPKLERELAIKTIKLSDEFPPETRKELVKLLLKEARLIARVTHPNIVAVYDVEDSSAAPFVAMEFIDGIALDAFIRKRGRLETPVALLMALGMARGLEAAHAGGIVHHDIKPANALVGSDGAVKVMDFGIAEAVSALAEQRDQLFGTPGYLAPETIQGKGSGPGGDIFALGASLYECLAGRRAFTGKDVRAALVATVQGRMTPIQKIAPEVPDAVVDLVAALMHPAPESRVPSASAAAARIEEVMRSIGAPSSAALLELVKGRVAEIKLAAKSDVKPRDRAAGSMLIPAEKLETHELPGSLGGGKRGDA